MVNNSAGESNVSTPFQHPVETRPWQDKELRHFWALVRKMPDGSSWLCAKLDDLGRKQLSDLTRNEWLDLLQHVRWGADPHYGQASDEQWSRMKWLQGELDWDDTHLENYIKKFAHIDAVRFLTVPSARGIITGMEKIRTRR